MTFFAGERNTEPMRRNAVLGTVAIFGIARVVLSVFSAGVGIKAYGDTLRIDLISTGAILCLLLTIVKKKSAVSYLMIASGGCSDLVGRLARLYVLLLISGGREGLAGTPVSWVVIEIIPSLMLWSSILYLVVNYYKNMKQPTAVPTLIE